MADHVEKRMMGRLDFGRQPEPDVQAQPEIEATALAQFYEIGGATTARTRSGCRPRA
jgi:hypothetical protein